MASKAAELDPQVTAQLIDDLRNNDVQIRLNSFRKVGAIARVLGPDRTRDEFVPYLNEFIDDDDDILLVLAEELGGLIPYIGGAAYAHSLLEPLETLAGVEENFVRDKAVESLTKIIAVMSEEHLLKHMFPLLKQLAHGDWFTSRISACGLFSAMYPRVNVNPRKELRAVFIQLCADETPMVRRAACVKFASFAETVEPQFAQSELLGALLKLTKDDQDSVRLLSVEAAVAEARVFKLNGGQGAKLLPTALQLCADKSWRVRYMAANKFCELADAVGESEGKNDEMIDSFAKLLQDTEAEVRTAAAFKVSDVSKLAGAEKTMKKLIMPIKQLVQDPCQFTRAALGREILGLAGVINKKDVFDHLLPLFLQLLKDSNADVRLNLISKLETVNQVIGVDLLSLSLLPAICELAMDKKWRVRLAIIKQIPQLAKQLGSDFFESKLSDLCMSWMGDQVYSVREEATANLTRLAEVFGAVWAKQHVVPKVVHICGHKSYVYRMTSLLAVRDLAAVLKHDMTTQQLLPIALSLAADPVANVRFTVAKTLKAIVPWLSADAIKSQVIPCLSKLMADTDADVQYYSLSAHEEITKAAK